MPKLVRHKHWPPDHPRFEAAPWCDLRTKRECDERWARRRGEAVRFSKEDWQAKEKQLAEDARTAGVRADEAFAAAEARRVEELLQREPARRAKRRHPVQGVRLPRKARQLRPVPVGD